MTWNKDESNAFKLLSGGGEMGQRIREFDWANHPLGPIKHWPSALISTLSTCLNAKFPMAIYWRAEGFLLYNDAWRPILGNKHPSAVGGAAFEVWPEIWDTINPLFESVRTTGQATWRGDELLPMQRFGYTEECYFDYTFNPILGETGVEGILNVVLETTFRVLNERRSRLLQELAACAASARTEQQACELAKAAIATDPADIPFALLYVVEPGRESARLVAATGLAAHLSARLTPVHFEEGAEQPWPLTDAYRGAKQVVVHDLEEKLGGRLEGHWPEPTTQALVLPVAASGQEGVAALLVVGVSPRRKLDEDYNRFFELVASHVGSALTGARGYEEQRQRAEALAELDRAKTTFFGNISHELRTPLTLILGPLEEEMRTSEAPRERLELAHRNCLRLLKLVNTLLDFSRIEAGRVEATFEPTDLAAYTADLASVFRSTVERAGLRLLVNCPPLPELVQVDRGMWEKIVFNLLSNAFKFTAQGEIEVKLVPAELVRQSNDHTEGQAAPAACLSVRDTGIGIPNAELQRVFERFHRVRNAWSRSHEGTGIGLALVQELVRLHGGSVTVSSLEGSGTTFTVFIPTERAHLPKERLGGSRELVSSPTHTGGQAFLEEMLRWLPEAAVAPGLMIGGNGQGRDGEDEHRAKSRPRILLADDNSDMRDYVRRLLVAQDWEVIATENGQTALEAARANIPSSC